ncbi:MAG: hypothetical protein JST36_11455 [Bacteroidetes bacterium]|nr:hypothetical protein [Bacteroidota bacterium]
MKKIVFIALLSCLLLSCTKWFNPPTDVLPPYSETGANTFGCTVDGKILVPRMKYFFKQ